MKGSAPGHEMDAPEQHNSHQNQLPMQQQQQCQGLQQQHEESQQLQQQNHQFHQHQPQQQQTRQMSSLRTREQRITDIPNSSPTVKKSNHSAREAHAQHRPSKSRHQQQQLGYKQQQKQQETGQPEAEEKMSQVEQQCPLRTKQLQQQQQPLPQHKQQQKQQMQNHHPQFLQPQQQHNIQNIQSKHFEPPHIKSHQLDQSTPQSSHKQKLPKEHQQQQQLLPEQQQQQKQSHLEQCPQELTSAQRKSRSPNKSKSSSEFSSTDKHHSAQDQVGVGSVAPGPVAPAVASGPVAPADAQGPIAPAVVAVKSHAIEPAMSGNISLVDSSSSPATSGFIQAETAPFGTAACEFAAPRSTAPASATPASAAKEPDANAEPPSAKATNSAVHYRKPRPNFIALPGRIRPELPRSSQVASRSLHSKIIQRTVEQHQNSTRSSKAFASPCTASAKEEVNNVNPCMNGYVSSEQQIAAATRSDEKENDLPRDSSPVPAVPVAQNHCAEGSSLPNKMTSRVLSSEGVNSPSDSLCSLDSTPWNMEGTETIVENPSKKARSAGSRGALEGKATSYVERELETLREENHQLKASLEEAGRLNAQWRAYHQERQGYVERLLATIHTLQQRHASTSPPNALLKGGADTGGATSELSEAQRMKEALVRAKAEYQEHVTLLQMQVRAHRDDWEAESAEKRLERTGREEAEARASLLLQELQHLQQQLSESENAWSTCSRCGAGGLQQQQRAGESSLVPYLKQNFSNSCQPKQPPANSDRTKQPGITNGQEKHASAIAAQDKLQSSSSTKASMKQSSSMNGGGGGQSNKGFGNAIDPSGKITTRSANQNKHPHANGLLKQSINEQSLPPLTNDCLQQEVGVVAAQPTMSPYNGHQTQYMAANGRVRTKELADQFLRDNGSCDSSSQSSVLATKGIAEFVNHGGLLTNAPPLAASAASAANSIPLKGWIPVSMMHQIAFGGLGHERRLRYPSSYTVQPINNYVNGPSSYMYRNYASPSTSRESSLLSCSSPENQNTVQSYPSNNIYPHYDDSGYEGTGARPKNGGSSYSSSRSTTVEDDQKKAKHRARNILANAIPVSPVSSAPSTPAGGPPRPYVPVIVQAPLNKTGMKSNSPRSRMESSGKHEKNSTNATQSKVQSSSVQQPDGALASSEECDGTEPILSLTNPTSSAKKIVDSSEVNGKRLTKNEKSENDNERKVNSAGIDTKSNSNNATTNPNQISSSTSNETSRSSSPGMSLTTFALTSEGRGIPGAICFSLHPDVKPSINTNIMPCSIEPTSPKNEMSISHVHIEPKSPKPSRSPIEISTKEHWWSVGEKEHFSYPEKVEASKSNGTLVNSTFVKLQDSGKKDSHSEQRTARAVSSLELAQRLKQSQEDYNKSQVNKTNSATNTTTFLFTPACNSSASSSTLSSLESSKASSPPRQPTTHLKSIASKNIASAIISYEIAAKGDRIVYSDRLKPSDVVAKSKHQAIDCPDGVATLTSKEIICPSCQMLFSKEQHLLFLDHFETCKGPEFADL